MGGLIYIRTMADSHLPTLLIDIVQKVTKFRSRNAHVQKKKQLFR